MKTQTSLPLVFGPYSRRCARPGGAHRSGTGFGHGHRRHRQRRPNRTAIVLRRLANHPAFQGENGRRHHCQLYPQFRQQLRPGCEPDCLSEATGRFRHRHQHHAQPAAGDADATTTGARTASSPASATATVVTQPAVTMSSRRRPMFRPRRSISFPTRRPTITTRIRIVHTRPITMPATVTRATATRIAARTTRRRHSPSGSAGVTAVDNSTAAGIAEAGQVGLSK